MKLFLFSIFILFNEALSQNSVYTTGCERDFKLSNACAKSKIESLTDSEWAQKIGEIHTGVSQCFTAIGCQPPEYDRDPVDAVSPRMQQTIIQMKAQWDGTPPAVKQCLKRRMLEKLGEKINQCLARQNVTRVNFASIDDPRVRAVSGEEGVSEGPFGAMEQVGNHTKAERARKKFFTKLNVARARRQCQQKMNLTRDEEISFSTCLLNVKFEHRGNYCENIRKPCTANVDPDCRKRGQEIHQAVCKCKKEHERSIVQKLDDLIYRTNGQVVLGDVIKTLSQQEDPLALIRLAKKCYDDNGVESPQALDFAEAIAEDQADKPDVVQKPTSMHPRIDQDTLYNLRDVLAFDAQDESECTPCQ